MKTKILDNETNVSKTDLKSDLKNLNIDSLIEKTIKGRNIWKAESKSKYNTEKTARKELRKLQLKYGNALLTAILTDQPTEKLENLAKTLQDFYNENLVNFSVFSNVSESGKHFEKIQKAYAKMKVILNIR